MKIIDLYSRIDPERPFQGYSIFENDPDLAPLLKQAHTWEMDGASTQAWLISDQARLKRSSALEFLEESKRVVERVESVLGVTLPGTLVFMPSFGDFDGFARYDSGEHLVLIGVDFPDADVAYLKALTSHELSHVFRDHAPEVWSHLGKPLAEVSRREYLDAGTAQEHLVSEGLATLFSQALYAEIPPMTHHYYEPDEWAWCQSNEQAIHDSLIQCLETDQDVWSYYGESRVSPGSPSRTQYYWAAQMLQRRILNTPDPTRALIELHQKPTAFFDEFRPERRK